MTDITGIIQVKGGVGRSTIATNLAAILSVHSPTLLIDCDLPQGTSASWYATRQASMPSDKLSLATAANHLELIDKIQEVAEGYCYIIIDAPPRIAEMTRAIIILSHLCLIPLGASAAEILRTRSKKAAKGLVQAEKRLAGVQEAGLKKVRKGLQGARQSLKNVNA